MLLHPQAISPRLRFHPMLIACAIAMTGGLLFGPRLLHRHHAHHRPSASPVALAHREIASIERAWAVHPRTRCLSLAVELARIVPLDPWGKPYRVARPSSRQRRQVRQSRGAGCARATASPSRRPDPTGGSVPSTTSGTIIDDGLGCRDDRVAGVTDRLRGRARAIGARALTQLAAAALSSATSPLGAGVAGVIVSRAFSAVTSVPIRMP